MLDNGVKREAVKATGVVLAMGVGGSIATTLSAVLGIAVESLGLLGEKRTKELFNAQALIDQVLEKIKASDDFASFVFDVWQRHNLESSKRRRTILKNFLVQEVNKDINDFENFSKIENLIQEINFDELKVLKILYSSGFIKNSAVKSKKGEIISYHTNTENAVRYIQKKIQMHEQDIEHHMVSLSSYGLLSIMHGRWDGPFYNQTKLGYLFLGYING